MDIGFFITQITMQNIRENKAKMKVATKIYQDDLFIIFLKFGIIKK